MPTNNVLGTKFFGQTRLPNLGYLCGICFAPKQVTNFGSNNIVDAEDFAAPIGLHLCSLDTLWPILQHWRWPALSWLTSGGSYLKELNFRVHFLKVALAIVTVTLLQSYIRIFTPNVAGRGRGK